MRCASDSQAETTMILSKVVQTAKNPHKKLRAEELMTRVIHYVAPEQEWQKKKKASKRKVAVPKQKVKTVTKVEESRRTNLLCFRIKKKNNSTFNQDNSVYCVEEGT